MRYLIGPYILDCRQRTLCLKAGELVSDKDRVISALALLAHKYPEVVMREELLEEVWPNKDVSEWALSRLISDIRQILGQTQEQEFLRTVHGKGFRLATEVRPADLGAEQLKSAFGDEPEDGEGLENKSPAHVGASSVAPASINRYLANKKLIIVFVALATVSIAVISVLLTTSKDEFERYRLKRFDLKAQNHFGEPGIETLSLKKDWSVQVGNRIVFEKNNTISFYPAGDEQNLSSHIVGPVNLNKATLVFGVSLDEEYIRSGASLGLYSNIIRENPIGEWDCYYHNEELKIGPQNFECILDEPGGPFNLKKDEVMTFGLRSYGKDVKGKIVLESAAIKYKKSFVEKHWLANNKLKIKYDGGVSYSPTSNAQTLEFKYAGPENFNRAKITFSIVVSQNIIDQKIQIQPYAQLLEKHNWAGEWGCWIQTNQLSVTGADYDCILDEPGEIFKLTEEDALLIGIATQQAQGRINGEIKVTNVEIEFLE